MTAKGGDFLENWITTNITSDTKLNEVVKLEERCIWEAAGLGIKREEIEEGGGNLEKAVHDAMANLGERSPVWLHRRN